MTVAEPKKLRIVDRPVTNLRVTRKKLEQQAWYSVPPNLRYTAQDDHGNIHFYVKHSPSANRYADMTELHTMPNAELLKLRTWPADTVVTEGNTMANANQIVEALLAESLTRAAFLAAYRAHLQKAYPWAADEAKLHKFMSSVTDTISGHATSWNFNGDAVTAAWREIGGSGKPTLKALRSLQ